MMEGNIMNVKQLILDNKIIAITRNVPVKHILDLAHVLDESGIKLLEITYDQSSPEGIQNALDAISLISEKMAEKFVVGAGTVMTSEQAVKAAQAGAKYIVSPNLNADVVRITKAMGLLSVPGAMTPTEIAQAWELGADFVKVFPAGTLGPAYFKSVRGPMPHIPLLATGGINPGNLVEYLKAGCAGVGAGGNLVSLELIKKGAFDEIKTTAQQYINILKAL
jgi:2-dehydro-3-deoxyphosphogluconate aldolase/(4S)-4-hydroxy-2-oxoglutarate aldolase